MAGKKRKRFGEVLLEAGIITQEQLEDALNAQKNSGKSLGEILEEQNIIEQKDIAATLAHQFGFKTARNIANHKFSASILELIDSQKALEKLIFPLKVENKKLYLAVVNPLDIETLDTLSFATGMHIVPIVTTPAEIHAAVNTHYLHNIVENFDDNQWRILVIDTPQMVNITAAILREAGYSVSTANNSSEALKLCSSTQPHLIIIESQIPDLDITRFHTALKHHNTTQKSPLMGLSFRATAAEEAKLLDMGFIDFIAKPVNSVRLLARVRRALRLLYHDEGR
ncbi:MAG: response regulator [Desulfuromonadaceae bacterium]|nr:response regulator [Geobacteraceae bacterium]